MQAKIKVFTSRPTGFATIEEDGELFLVYFGWRGDSPETVAKQHILSGELTLIERWENFLSGSPISSRMRARFHSQLADLKTARALVKQGRIMIVPKLEEISISLSYL
jgi:hypothetical protein